MKARERLGLLVKGIRKDLSACQDLEHTLVEQQKMLSRQDTGALQQLGESILKHIDGIQRSAGERSAHLRALGLLPGTEGLTVLASKLPETLNQQLMTDWRQLEKALTRCKTLNERNGELLASHRTALATLTGQPVNQYGHEPG